MRCQDLVRPTMIAILELNLSRGLEDLAHGRARVSFDMEIRIFRKRVRIRRAHRGIAPDMDTGGIVPARLMKLPVGRERFRETGTPAYMAAPTSRRQACAAIPPPVRIDTRCPRRRDLRNRGAFRNGDPCSGIKGWRPREGRYPDLAISRYRFVRFDAAHPDPAVTELGYTFDCYLLIVVTARLVSLLLAAFSWSRISLRRIWACSLPSTFAHSRSDPYRAIS